MLKRLLIRLVRTMDHNHVALDEEFAPEGVRERLHCGVLFYLGALERAWDDEMRTHVYRLTPQARHLYLQHQLGRRMLTVG